MVNICEKVVIKLFAKICSKVIIRSLASLARSLLLLSGDVESNPGPKWNTQRVYNYDTWELDTSDIVHREKPEKKKGKDKPKAKKSTFDRSKYRTAMCKYGGKCPYRKEGACYYWHPSFGEPVFNIYCNEPLCKRKCGMKHLGELDFTTSQKCKFNPCLRENCPFIHKEKDIKPLNLGSGATGTRMCRFKDKCERLGCPYAHSRKELRENHTKHTFKALPDNVFEETTSELDFVSGRSKNVLSSKVVKTESVSNSINENMAAIKDFREIEEQMSNDVEYSCDGTCVSDVLLNEVFKTESVSNNINENMASIYTQISEGLSITTKHNYDGKRDVILEYYPDMYVCRGTGRVRDVITTIEPAKKNVNVGGRSKKGHVELVRVSASQPLLKLFEGETLLEYPKMDTVKGDCGKPVYIEGELAGLHVISSDLCNYAIPVTKDVVSEIELIAKKINRKLGRSVEITGEIQGDADKESNIIDKVAPLVGELVSGSTSMAGIFDQPAVHTAGAQSINTVNIPREVYSTGFDKSDYNRDCSQVVSADSFVDLDQRIKIPSRIQILSWNTSEQSGTLLASYRVTPMLCLKYGLGTAGVAYDSNMLMAAGLYYKYWRGTIAFDIDTFPTHFHQGQLFVCFNPDPQTANITFDEAWNLQGVTIDLSVANSTRFEVPFVYPLDYCINNTRPVGLGDTIDSPEANTSIGEVYVFVQNKLKAANANVPGAIDINVSLSAGNDFEYKVPRPLTLPTNFEYRQNRQWRRNVVLSPPARLQGDDRSGAAAMKAPVIVPTYYRPDSGSNAKVVGDSDTADTTNIFDRKYLVKNNISITASQTVGTLVADVPLPTSIFIAQLATQGISGYHAFYRSDFEVTVKLSTTPFQAGCLRVVYEPITDILQPYGNGQNLDTWASFSASAQLPHVDLNFNGQTEAKFIVPWSAVARVITNPTRRRIGKVKLYIWNQLRTVQGDIECSVFLRALDPIYAVRRVTGVLQGEDTEEGDAPRQNEMPRQAIDEHVEVSAIEDSGQSHSPYLDKVHFKAIELLKRQDLVGGATINLTTSIQVNQARRFQDGSLYGGFNHSFIEGMYAFNSGSVRVTAQSDFVYTNKILMFAIYNPLSSQVAWTATDINDANNGLDVRYIYPSIGTVWHLGRESQKTVEFPQYSASVIRQYYGNSIVDNTTAGPGSENGQLQFLIQATEGFGSGSDNGVIVLTRSVGEDFRMYYPIPPPVLVETTTARDEAINVHTFKKDLTIDGDVESNPGPPTFSKFYTDDCCSAPRRGITETTAKGAAVIDDKKLRRKIEALLESIGEGEDDDDPDELSEQAGDEKKSVKEKASEAKAAFAGYLTRGIKSVKGWITGKIWEQLLKGGISKIKQKYEKFEELIYDIAIFSIIG